MPRLHGGPAPPAPHVRHRRQPASAFSALSNEAAGPSSCPSSQRTHRLCARSRSSLAPGPSSGAATSPTSARFTHTARASRTAKGFSTSFCFSIFSRRMDLAQSPERELLPHAVRAPEAIGHRLGERVDADGRPPLRRARRCLPSARPRRGEPGHGETTETRFRRMPSDAHPRLSGRLGQHPVEAQGGGKADDAPWHDPDHQGKAVRESDLRIGDEVEAGRLPENPTTAAVSLC